MNGSDPLAFMESRDATLLTKPSAFDQAEFDALRAFYRAWEDLHAIPKEKAYRRKQEDAAQRLTNQMHILRRMTRDD